MNQCNKLACDVLSYFCSMQINLTNNIVGNFGMLFTLECILPIITGG